MLTITSSTKKKSTHTLIQKKAYHAAHSAGESMVAPAYVHIETIISRSKAISSGTETPQ